MDDVRKMEERVRDDSILLQMARAIDHAHARIDALLLALDELTSTAGADAYARKHALLCEALRDETIAGLPA